MIHIVCKKIEPDNAGALLSTRHKVDFNNTCILAVIMEHLFRPKHLLFSEGAPCRKEHCDINIPTENGLFLKELPLLEVLLLLPWFFPH